MCLSASGSVGFLPLEATTIELDSRHKPSLTSRICGKRNGDIGKLHLDMEVRVSPGSTAVSEAVFTNIPLASLAVEVEYLDESHPQGFGSPVVKVPSPLW